MYVFAVFGIAVAPLFEEIIFRGFLFKVLSDIRRAGHSGLGNGDTCLLYFMCRSCGEAGRESCLIFVVGYVLSFVRQRSNSLIPSFIIHTSYNGMLFGVFALSTLVAERVAAQLIHIAFVQRRALARNEAGILNDAAKFGVICAISGAGSADDVFFDHDAAHVIDAESQANLSDLQTDRQPRNLDVGDIVEVDPA